MTETRRPREVRLDGFPQPNRFTIIIGAQGGGVTISVQPDPPTRGETPALAWTDDQVLGLIADAGLADARHVELDPGVPGRRSGAADRTNAHGSVRCRP